MAPHNVGVSKTARPPGYTEIAKQIGKRIRWARELIEPNRAEFARGLGVDRSTIRDIESGRRPPSIFNVLEISHQLRVTPDYILIGRMRDVDGELAGKLAILHPELIEPAASGDTSHKVSGGNIAPPPTKPKRRSR